jgi:hypothetical protein
MDADTEIQGTMNSRSDTAVQFLSNHVAELITAAVLGTDRVIASATFTIMERGPKKLLLVVSESPYLQSLATDIFAMPSDPGLARFAALTELCLRSFPSNLLSSFPFFNQFLLHCDNYAVPLMMKGLLPYQDNLKPLYTQLIAMDFVPTIIKRISESKNASNFGQLRGLYEVLLQCAENRKLRKECLVPSVISEITELMVDDCRLDDIRWQLMCEIADFTNRELNISSFQAAADFLIEANTMTPGLVTAMTFCSQILRESPECARAIDLRSLAKSIQFICLEFPNHSIGLKAALRLIANGMLVSDVFIDIFAPFFVDQIRDTQSSRVLRMFVIQGMQRISEMAEDEPELADRLSRYDEFIAASNVEVRAVAAQLHQRYGGDLPD